jgi:hypothetical protein
MSNPIASNWISSGIKDLLTVLNIVGLELVQYLILLSISSIYLYWSIERGVNQLSLCLKNYAYFKLFTNHSTTITIMQGGKQSNIQHQSHT